MLTPVINKKKVIHNVIIFLFILLFIFLTTKYKIKFEAAVRPLYTIGLMSSFFLFCWYLFRSKTARNLAANMLIKPQILIFLILLFYIFISSVAIFYFEPVRQIKDTLYFIFWILIIPLISLFLVSKKIGLKESFVIFNKSIVFFALISIVLGFFMIFGLGFEVGPVLISQSVYFPFRVHGPLGEPTALAALMGTALIALMYLKNVTNQKNKALILIILFGIIATGSRNVVVALILVYSSSLFFETFKIKKIIISSIFIISTATALVAVIYALNLDEIIYAIFFDRPDFDVDNRFSRIYTYLYTINEILSGTTGEFLFGQGAYELRREFGAAYNSILEITHDFGILMSLCFILLFFLSFIAGYLKYKTSGLYIYKYACMLLVYGFSFNLFMSYFPTTWFNFATLSFVMGIWITAIPIKTMLKYNY